MSDPLVEVFSAEAERAPRGVLFVGHSAVARGALKFAHVHPDVLGGFPRGEPTWRWWGRPTEEAPGFDLVNDEERKAAKVCVGAVKGVVRCSLTRVADDGVERPRSST